MGDGDDRRLTTSDLATSGDEDLRGSSGGQDADANATRAEVRDEPLLALSDLEGFRERWETIQIGFVDEPREAVARADELVAEMMRQLADTFARERSQLEGQWDRGDDVSTEELRITLQRYRSFFNRLLHT